MTAINEADKLRLGAQVVDRVYHGGVLVWEPPAPVFGPDDLANLTVWIDASQLGLADGEAVSEWPNRGSGSAGGVAGSPAPVLRAAALNGLPVVRFRANEGRLRGLGMCADGSFDLTVLYVARMWGPNVGRIFTNAYPPYNFLVGAHTVGEPVMYDNGWVGPQPAWGAFPSPWKLYGCVCNGPAGKASKFYVGGALVGSHGTSLGHDNRWNISGYGGPAEETCDCEVAELVAYDRTLPDAERQQLEAYLQAKWGL
jgi:hypothetical protein